MPESTSNDNLLTEIKSKGYWTISFSPIEFDNKAIPSLPECKALLTSSAVRLRGWPYPATRDADSHEPISFSDYVEARIDWEDCKEICRLYQSQKFVHLLALREDWHSFEGMRTYYRIPQNENKILSTVATVYQFTEILEFLLSLAKAGLYRTGVKVEIGLHNAGKRILVTDSNRGPLFQLYRCHTSDIILNKQLSLDQINVDTRAVAIDLLIDLFHQFNWDNPPRGVFEEDQRKLLSHQI